ncbi:alpha/beta fold hydrolase [Phytomonospora endophytica]|uniref:Pimeloyl-ACP methyl ester carboxylesterase n=1 Tax=Phytomonospora endophytica TaxID=714109 RepID=A0A841FQQ5_9ACTN|nr:alpha/beta hydrolase [Phytomonospora endophytica]MBB6037163.1 pimeloyl-ACP methyl ester carboxylesterase [Phytomonospora endophytica]GIG71203.1 alpha/beta hydrolase [Phytomonospora endophytica]
MWVDDSGGDGLPVVLLHPGWGDSAIWEPLLELLPDDVRTIRFDARGHGLSPAPASPFSVYDDLLDVLDHCEVDEAVFVGSSGGAATALSLAVAEPEQVAGLVLVSPGVSDYPWDFGDPYFARFGELYEERDVDGLLDLGRETWARSGLSDAVEAQLRSGVLAMLAQDGLAEADPPAFDGLDEIDVPAAVVLGDLDHPLVNGCAIEVAARIPDCELVTVTGADHLLPLRAPEILARLVLRIRA